MNLFEINVQRRFKILVDIKINHLIIKIEKFKGGLERTWPSFPDFFVENV